MSGVDVFLPIHFGRSSREPFASLLLRLKALAKPRAEAPRGSHHDPATDLPERDWR